MKQFLVLLGQLLTLTALWGNSSSGTLGQTDACNNAVLQQHLCLRKCNRLNFCHSHESLGKGQETVVSQL